MITSGLTEPIPSIVDVGKYNVIEITSMCFADNTTRLDYEAIRQHIKLRYLVGRQQRLNRRMKIGLISYDVCHDKKKLGAVLSQMYLDMKYRTSKGNGCVKDSSNVISVVSFMPHYLTKLAAEVLALNDFMYFAYNNHSGMDVIPHKASTNMFSSDILLNADVNIIVDIVRTNRFKYISLLYLKNNAQSLVSIHRQQLWDELIKIPGICVDMKDLHVSSPENISSYIESIKRNKKIRLVIIWSKRIFRESFINQTDDMQNRIWMWYSDNTFDNNYDYYINPTSLACHIFIWHPFYVYQHLNTRFQYKDIKRNILQKTYDSILNDPWIKRFNDENEINASDSKMFSHFDHDKSIIGEHIESLITPLWWSQPFKILYRRSMGYLMWYVRYLARVRMCRHILVDPENTTRLSCSLKDVKSIFIKVSNRENGLCCKPVKCPPGKEPVKTTFKKKGFIKVFRWKCKKCPSDKVKSNYSRESCVHCPGTTVPNKDLIECYDPYKDIYLTFTDLKSLVLLSILFPFLIYNLVLIFIFYYFRHTPIIVASGSTANLVQLSAHLLISIELLLLFFGKLSTIKCTLQVATTGILFTLILSILFTKTQKILFAFEAKIQVSKNDVVVTKAVEIFVSVLLIAVQILISVVSYFQLTPSVETTIDTESISRKLTCSTKLYFRTQFVYILILAIMCAIQAFRARNLPKYFTETTEIAYSMYITLVVIMIRFPILSSEKVKDKNFANAIFIILLNNTQMVIRYTKMFYTVLFHPEKNTKKYVRNMIMQDIRRKTEECIAERIRRNTGQEIYESKDR